MTQAARVDRPTVAAAPEAARGAFAAKCFAARRWQPIATHQTALVLPAEAAQGLADLMPVLICGEASAELTFDHFAERLPGPISRQWGTLLKTIAADEREHAKLLAELAQFLPPPSQRSTARHAASFLRRLATDDIGLHLSRISALDAGVCFVLAALCRAGTPVAAEPRLRALFLRIRRDEGRHVRISRAAAMQLGVDETAQGRERERVISGLSTLLAPLHAPFSELGVDYAALQTRFNLYRSMR